MPPKKKQSRTGKQKAGFSPKPNRRERKSIERTYGGTPTPDPDTPNAKLKKKRKK